MLTGTWNNITRYVTEKLLLLGKLQEKKDGQPIYITKSSLSQSDTLA